MIWTRPGAERPQLNFQRDGSLGQGRGLSFLQKASLTTSAKTCVRSSSVGAIPSAASLKKNTSGNQPSSRRSEDHSGSCFLVLPAPTPSMLECFCVLHITDTSDVE
mmetsp:Transcript_146506/g.255569  ORF Transcript_146506/g.255569 Transcript_146506/m.255569 type:complete len:106 (+) Transcript_146506:1435-1752(+)